MLISFNEFQNRRLQALQVKRLENLSNVCAKNHHPLLSEGESSEKELVLVFLLILFFILIAIIVSIKLALVFVTLTFISKAHLKKNRLIARERAFLEEYPSILLATSSNLKAGLSVYSSLERAIQLLDDKSIAKIEVKKLLEKVSNGMPKEEALKHFADGIKIPEVRLFKRAFFLVLTHGGRFSRTLERLSEVSRDRDALIKSARVSTASMRMTANVLLGIAPFLILMLSLRTHGFWRIVSENSMAFNLFSVGIFIVLLSFYILRKLSNFKP